MTAAPTTAAPVRSRRIPGTRPTATTRYVAAKMTAAVSKAGGLDPFGKPRPRSHPAAQIVEIPAGRDGQRDEERQEEEEERHHERDVAARHRRPSPLPSPVEEVPEAEAGVGDRLEEVVA